MKGRKKERGGEREGGTNKITFPFCFTLALIAIPWPMAKGLQTGGHGRANRRVQFFFKGKI